MKINNGNERQERRQKRVFTPAIYFLAEITLAWLLLSIINISFSMEVWATWSHITFFTITLYSAYKTYHIYERQKNLKTY